MTIKELVEELKKYPEDWDVDVDISNIELSSGGPLYRGKFILVEYMESISLELQEEVRV